MRNDIQERIAKNVKRLREDRGLSQLELARKMGAMVRPTWVSSVENGRRGVGRKMLARLCKALNVDPTVIVAQDRPPYPASEEELNVLELYRAVKEEGVAEEWLQYGLFKIGDEKRKKRKKQKKQASWSRRKYPKKPGQHEAMDDGKTVRPQESQESVEEDHHERTGS